MLQACRTTPSCFNRAEFYHKTCLDRNVRSDAKQCADGSREGRITSKGSEFLFTLKIALTAIAKNANALEMLDQ